ncbi:hypothetical protein QJS66_01585 [Kocuria rhizophila]|nr:hypothetical protein QJS66_01585 [Kocuria rhizophila]
MTKVAWGGRRLHQWSTRRSRSWRTALKRLFDESDGARTSPRSPSSALDLIIAATRAHPAEEQRRLTKHRPPVAYPTGPWANRGGHATAHRQGPGRSQAGDEKRISQTRKLTEPAPRSSGRQGRASLTGTLPGPRLRPPSTAAPVFTELA